MTRVFFLPLLSRNFRRPIIFQIFTGLLFFAYVEIHQVRRLVFDNYQWCPLSLMFIDSIFSHCIQAWRPVLVTPGPFKDGFVLELLEDLDLVKPASKIPFRQRPLASSRKCETTRGRISLQPSFSLIPYRIFSYPCF